MGKDAARKRLLVDVNTGLNANSLKLVSTRVHDGNALQQFSQAVEERTPIGDAYMELYSSTASIIACERANLWQQCISLLEQMYEQRTHPNLVAYRSVMRACGHSARWQSA